MALAFPYTYISCPCSDASRRLLTSKRSSREIDYDAELEEEEKTFDPRHPRSSFSLFPPEHLLYCEECHDIKCPRCVTEEIISHYCPSCLFETPSTMARGDMNRCPRNCFMCPICRSQLTTAPIGENGFRPFILNCNYCMWSTLDIGIKLRDSYNIRDQMTKINNGGELKPSAEAKDKDRKSSLAREPFSPQNLVNDTNPMDQIGQAAPLDPATRFNALRSFYKDQIASSSGSNDIPTSQLDYALNSPSSLARIMNLYSRDSSRKPVRKATAMREALTVAEGLQLPKTMDPTSYDPPDYLSTVTPAQRTFQYPLPLGNPASHLVSELRPMSTRLVTKRSKRCAACKHILVKPEFKPTSTRYRIKLIALNYIPLISLKPVPVPGGLRPSGPDGSDVVLEAGKPSQWIMTLKNPLFENVSVSLGTPSITPGPHGHKVTILCPQFSIGKNGDVWDDAINPSVNKDAVSLGSGEQIAGKLYDQGRNWASVVVEVVPASIVREQGKELEEDEDVIEVPIRVRLEWKVSEEDDAGAKKKSEKITAEDGVEDDGRREVSYWMVMGIARVAC